MSQGLIRALQQNLTKATRLGQWSAAELILTDLKREDPLGKITRLLELEYLVARGHWHEAEGLCQIFLTVYADSSRFNFLAGRTHYAAKRYVDAERFFTESLRQFDSREGARWLGRTLTQLGKFDEARDLLERLLSGSENPANGRDGFVIALLKDLAWLLRRQGHLALALEHYERAQSLKPADEWLAQEIQKLRGELLEPAAVEEEIQQLTVVGDVVPSELYLTWVDKLLAQGRIAEARVALRDPACPGLTSAQTLRLAWSCYHAGVYELAFSYFLTLLPERLEDFKLSTSLEKAATLLGKQNELLEHYEELAPSAPHLYGKIKKIKKRASS